MRDLAAARARLLEALTQGALLSSWLRDAREEGWDGGEPGCWECGGKGWQRTTSLLPGGGQVVVACTCSFPLIRGAEA